MSTIDKEHVVNPSGLQIWDKHKKLETAFYDCFQLQEVVTWMLGNLALGEDAKYDFRQSLLDIAKSQDLTPKCNRVVLQDEDETSGIMMIIRQTREQEDGTPLIEIAYTHNTQKTLTAAKLNQIAAATQNMTCATQIKATVSEQKIMLKYLKKNTAKLDSQYVSEVKQELRHLPIFIPSFIAIVKPPSNKSQRKEEKPQKQCMVCKNPAPKLCSICLSASYCSKECQLKHWKDGHKKSLWKTSKRSGKYPKQHCCIDFKRSQRNAKIWVADQFAKRELVRFKFQRRPGELLWRRKIYNESASSFVRRFYTYCDVRQIKKFCKAGSQR
eukprot:TRINITY_DN16924_c2_g1_i1.p1 TRINITY_DN16924_c2_g1~~TRINITY_DN16924_c2_g1_i1.p1  ORF type:complete len:327 (+),score=22.49 TRINITY_DN16924_c2_g1_i1:108-1088(+)